MANKNKHKKMNGYATALVNGSAYTEDVPGEAGDIRKHISEISQVSGPHFSQRFVRLNGPGRGERDRMINHRKLPQPRNIKLVESESEDEERENKFSAFEEFFDENAVLAGIRSMNGGHESSNLYLEQRWTRQQDVTEDIDRVTNLEKDKKEASGVKSKRDVFARNVGMRAIMKQRMEKNIDSTTREETAKHSAVNNNQDAENKPRTRQQQPTKGKDGKKIKETSAPR